MLAAHGLGLGSCFIGMAYQYLNTPEAKTELGIPQEYTVAAPLILGRPQGGQFGPAAAKNAPEVLFWK
jgi:nitroreductase